MIISTLVAIFFFFLGDFYGRKYERATILKWLIFRSSGYTGVVKDFIDIIIDDIIGKEHWN